MAMGIVSPSEFEKEHNSLIKPESPKPDATIVDITRGRPEGSVEVPNGLRKIIGDEAITNGRQSALELARTFGISPSSVSAYANGSTSTASYDEKPNGSLINLSKDRVAKRARGKLMKALHHINDDKLEGAKARELAGIAKDMSVVIKNMEPDNPQGQVNNGPTFVFYSPQPRKEDTFDVIFAKE